MKNDDTPKPDFNPLAEALEKIADLGEKLRKMVEAEAKTADGPEVLDILAPRPEGYKFPSVLPLPSPEGRGARAISEMMSRLSPIMLCYVDNDQTDDAKALAAYIKTLVAAGRADLDANPCECPACTAERAVDKARMPGDTGALSTLARAKDTPLH